MTTAMQTRNSGRGRQFKSQVRIRTSPNASPENVGAFVGSDSTDSVTAPACLQGKLLEMEGGTHAHTRVGSCIGIH